MLSISVLFGCLLSCLVRLTAAVPHCNVTQVNTYEYDCGRRGVIASPDPIPQTSTARVASALECGKLCLEQQACKSFNYTIKVSQCTLYGKYLDEMKTSFKRGPGPLYDRGCFTSSCNVIKACAATESCRYTYPKYYYNGYTQYACNYGKVAKSYGYSSQTIEFESTLSACDAVNECAFQTNYGSFDVHFLPDKGGFGTPSWQCVLFDDDPSHYQTKKAEKISRRRYTEVADGVGAGYGYYFSYEYS